MDPRWLRFGEHRGLRKRVLECFWLQDTTSAIDSTDYGPDGEPKESVDQYTKGGFPNEDSLMKLLYQGVQNASRKWAMPLQNWNLTLSQLAIFFEGRLDGALNL